MERATYQWTEDALSQEQTSTSVATDAMSKTMSIKVNWTDIGNCIQHIIGHASVYGNPYTGYGLSRQTPAKHPKWPWLRATKILSINGRLGSKSLQWAATAGSVPPGVENKNTGVVNFQAPPDTTQNPITQQQGQFPIKCGQFGIYGSWDQAKVTILFEAPKYPILEDNQISAEYQRYILQKYDTNLETLSRRGEIWQWINSTANTFFKNGFPGDLLLKQAKGILTWTWMDVPQEYIMLGRLIPTNLLRLTGTVNQFLFPKFGVPNQNIPNDPVTGNPTIVQFPPGTLLMLPIKTEPRNQIHPQVLGIGAIDPFFFPRTFDVSFSMIHFDPQPNGEGISPNGGGGLSLTTPAYGNPGDPQILIQGHNLVPTPLAVPLAPPNYRWWAAGRSQQPIPPQTAPIPPVSGLSDTQLLYQYRDFEQAWQAAT